MAKSLPWLLNILFTCSSTDIVQSLVEVNALLVEKLDEVPPRFELGSLDSESRVLTITPWNLDVCRRGPANINSC